MSNRVISDPTVAGWELDPATGYWMWAGAGSAYDDTEVRGLISANTDLISDNATAISENSGRLDSLEAGGGAVDAYTKTESDSKYVPKSGNTTIAGTLYASDFIAS